MIYLNDAANNKQPGESKVEKRKRRDLNREIQSNVRWVSCSIRTRLSSTCAGLNLDIGVVSEFYCRSSIRFSPMTACSQFSSGLIKHHGCHYQVDNFFVKMLHSLRSNQPHLGNDT